MGTTAQKLTYLQETKNDIISTLTDKLSGIITFDASKETFRNLCTKYVNAIGSTGIAYSAFAHCPGLTSVNITDPITSIGDYAFGGCSNITSVTVSDSVTSIGEQAFNACTSLTSVAIGSGVTGIGYQAFVGCRNLNSITVAVGNPVYHSYGNCIIETGNKVLIQGSNSGIIQDDGSVTFIGEEAFYGCIGLHSITVPDSVTGIRDYAFSGCSGLTEVTIGNGVTYIGYEAFGYCTGLSSVTIGNGVTNIDEEAFKGINADAFTVKATTPPSISSYGGLFGMAGSQWQMPPCQIYVPSASVNAYKNDGRWSHYAAYIVADPNE